MAFNATLNNNGRTTPFEAFLAQWMQAVDAGQFPAFAKALVYELLLSQLHQRHVAHLWLGVLRR